MNLVSLLLFVAVFVPSAYWFTLALASVRPPGKPEVAGREPQNKFAVVIPAHDEEHVIESTVSKLLEQNYPRRLYNVFVVADFCTDLTAQRARKAGALVLERKDGARTGKGGALSWAFEKIFTMADNYDAAIIFDADTRVEANFLKIIEARLAQGECAIQGQHIISNPGSGWFPALTWAMFMVDNRFQNLGRSNLGWSAKHMGDSICFRSDVLKKLGWGQGLTEDYQLRQRLLLEGIRIVYEPYAIGYGEAALTWKQAQTQRFRWLRGVQDANRQLESELYSAWLRRRTGLLVDGLLQAFTPSYSTLALVSMILLIFQIAINVLLQPVFSPLLLIFWGLLVSLLILYPLLGLALERAPIRAYVAIMLGFVFIFWRTWLALKVRFHNKPIAWVRTDHRGTQ